MTRSLVRLWHTLEALPQRGAERLEWQLQLGDEWRVAERFLRSTGRLAQAVGCPSPGGDGCPRIVVHHADGRIVAVCGDKPQRCERIDLQMHDIEVLEFDVDLFCARLRQIFSLNEPRGRVLSSKLSRVGVIGVQAGISLGIYIGFPSQADRITALDLPQLDPDEKTAVLLTPVPGAADLPRNWSQLSLRQILGEEDGDLAATESAVVLISELSAKAVPTTSKVDAVVWALPHDARWEEFTFEFISDESLIVRFRGQTRTFEPDQLSMKNERTHKGTMAWALLRLIVRDGGRLSLSNPSTAAKVRKQKETLSKKLQRSFGITEDPFLADRHGYTARFKVMDSRPGAAPARRAHL